LVDADGCGESHLSPDSFQHLHHISAVEVEPRFDRRREAGERIDIPTDLLNLLRADPFVGKQPTERLWSLSRSRAWQLIKGIMAHAGIAPGPHATPKGLRHGFDLHAIRSGVPLNLVQRWLGHARMETTAIYLQARPFNSSRLFLILGDDALQLPGHTLTDVETDCLDPGQCVTVAKLLFCFLGFDADPAGDREDLAVDIERDQTAPITLGEEIAAEARQIVRVLPRIPERLLDLARTRDQLSSARL
jgi:hypothetical protein